MFFMKTFIFFFLFAQFSNPGDDDSDGQWNGGGVCWYGGGGAAYEHG